MESGPLSNRNACSVRGRSESASIPIMDVLRKRIRSFPKKLRDHALVYRFCPLLTYLHPIVSGSIFAWRWSFQMQAVNMSDQFSFRGPSTEVEAQHLIRPLGRCSSDPQADQQARNKGRIHLDAHPVDPLAQQMPAAQHTFDPAEKQLHRP